LRLRFVNGGLHVALCANLDEIISRNPSEVDRRLDSAPTTHFLAFMDWTCESEGPRHISQLTPPSWQVALSGAPGPFWNRNWLVWHAAQLF
jgi:hypothetical protein